MPFKHVDMDSAMRRLADRRIEDAMQEGKFDNLPGKGKPLDLEPMPADENARMTWWALRLMKGNDFTPDEVRLRKRVDVLRDELKAADTEARVALLVTALNAAVRNVNTLGTNAINIPVAPANLDDELCRFRERVGRRGPDASRDVGRAPGVPRARAGIRLCPHNSCKSRNAADARFCRTCGRKFVP